MHVILATSVIVREGNISLSTTTGDALPTQSN